MNEDKLMKKIDDALSGHDRVDDKPMSDLARAAFERRFLTVLIDLGLEELAPKVRFHRPAEVGAQWEVTTKFAVLNWRDANRILRRLEDIERARATEAQVHQETALF